MKIKTPVFPRPTWIGENLNAMIVAVIKIHASSGILAKVQSKRQLSKFREVVEEVDQYFYESRNSHPMPSPGGGLREINVEHYYYKFVGDGWILFFPPNIGSSQLLVFFAKLCRLFSLRCVQNLGEFLFEERQQSTGEETAKRERLFRLRIGVAKGEIAKFKIRAADEYVGVPLVVAKRLQEAGKPFITSDSDPLLIERYALPESEWEKGDLKRYNPIRKRLGIRDHAEIDCMILSVKMGCDQIEDAWATLNGRRSKV